MIALGDTPQSQLVAFARAWFRLLAQAEWEAALGMIDQSNRDGTRWTRETITALVEDTFGPGTRFATEFGPPVFSDPDSAIGDPHPNFGRLDAGGFWLDHDVPLNGTFSDLTAQFEFEPREDGCAAILHDLHVL